MCETVEGREVGGASAVSGTYVGLLGRAGCLASRGIVLAPWEWLPQTAVAGLREG